MTQETQTRIDEYWTDRAPSYDAYQRRPDRYAADHEVWQQVWAEALPVAPADVLDVGTGSGHVALLVAGLGHRVTGIDLADGMLEIARAHATRAARPPRFERGDAVDPPFPADSFDAVVGRYVAWTLRAPGDALRAWRRLLRPGGRLALVDSTWFPQGIQDEPGGVGGYDAALCAELPLSEAASIEATADAVRDAGFTDVEVTPLEQVLALDEEHGVAPGHEVRLQFLVTGRA